MKQDRYLAPELELFCVQDLQRLICSSPVVETTEISLDNYYENVL